MKVGVGFVVFLRLCVVLISARLQALRIIGGDYANSINEFKYMASVVGKQKFLCGGVIIGERHILTAAHCTLDKEGNFHKPGLAVGVGDTRVDGMNVIAVRVAKVYIPVNYKRDIFADDIGVLELVRDLHLSSTPTIEKINLPPPNAPSYANEIAVLSGFGAYHTETEVDQQTNKLVNCNTKYDLRLKYVNIRVISNKECKKKYKNEICSDKEIYGKAEKRKKILQSPCSGDSGSPLVKDKTVIGIHSSAKVGSRENPSAYTRVSSYLDFIENAMKGIKTQDMRTYDYRLNKED